MVPDSATRWGFEILGGQRFEIFDDVEAKVWAFPRASDRGSSFLEILATLLFSVGETQRLEGEEAEDSDIFVGLAGGRRCAAGT